MGTHPIFESDFDCLTERQSCRCRREFNNGRMEQTDETLPREETSPPSPSPPTPPPSLPEPSSDVIDEIKEEQPVEEGDDESGDKNENGTENDSSTHINNLTTSAL